MLEGPERLLIKRTTVLEGPERLLTTGAIVQEGPRSCLKHENQCWMGEGL